MQPALLLIDLQSDYLRSPALDPHPDAICEKATCLLKHFRDRSQPIIHVWTTIRDDSDRMPHWRERDVQVCIEGTAGHQTTLALQPGPDELVVHKQFFSAFSSPELLPQLKAMRIDTLVLAGVYLRACVRTTAIDAYQNGFSVIVAEDAVGDDDPVHAAVTRQYLEKRSTRFLPADQIVNEAGCEDRIADGFGVVLPSAVIAGANTQASSPGTQAFFSPRDGTSEAFRLASARQEDVIQAVQCSQNAKRSWQQTSIDKARRLLTGMADAIDEQHQSLACLITRDIGKPIKHAHAEIRFATELIRAAIRQSSSNGDVLAEADWRAVRRPLGVVAIITPWNNPLAIALGKITPALLYGNTVVWKPAMRGAAVAGAVLQVMNAAGLPADIVSLVNGDRASAETLIAQLGVDAVTFTGSTAAGTAAQTLAASRHLPFQAEMGGNNAAIVRADADLNQAAAFIAAGAFGSAGQRRTATRRAIVDRRCFEQFLDSLQREVGSLHWGDPQDEQTDIGPVVSASAVARLSAVVQRAAASGARIVQPLNDPQIPPGCERGYYFPPTVVVVSEATSELWQTETFGPLLVVHCVESWDEGIQVCNAVRQGLVASLFTQSNDRTADFLQRAEAGILRINCSTAGANPRAPFGGWKCSSVGPPEHSVGDLEFYTRWQTWYGEFPN